MKFKLIMICILGILAFSGCKKFDEYLDKAETGGLSEQEVFGDYVQTERYLANVYSHLPNEWMPVNSFTYAAASDEAKCPVVYFNGPQVFTRGLISPNHNPIDVWASLYAAIRKVNRFIERIDAVPAKNATQIAGKSRMKGEAYFLRAFFYAELHKRYGRVPVIDRVLQVNDDLNIPRNSEEELVRFIVDDCNEATANLLPVNTAANIGRATKGAALMLKSRVLLYAASLLHNPSSDVQKWQRAADAAEDVMKLNLYQVDGDYKHLFHKRTASNIIFQSTFNNTGWVQQMFVPSQGGLGWIQPLQNLVDDYEMTNGLKPNETGSGYDASHPYANRDPRLAASIIHNGSIWRENAIETFVDGVDGLTSAEGAKTQTGYYLRKLLDENGSMTPDNRPGDHFWVFMRYEETLLNFAEAKNEALSSPDNSVYEAVNAVRTRAGINMPALPAGLNKAQMRERIRREKRIELAFEGFRFWDIRRWRIGKSVMREARGMRVVNQGAGSFSYTPFLVESRIYEDAFDLFPIPQSERNRNTALDQNDGYN
ncbi:RagB/SusD family nutrient uptake outer membrane protein [Pedobacter sp. ASV1-7]|uniref:RagB/SusD family nutrient uptake outer membrane protein n=1 Tax=Pedobacter sp. ASV1-7 TaxID=3145237 RepID=UPI0032E888D9